MDSGTRRRRLPIEGFILAGGQSSRFGSDKARAILGGRTLLSRALATLRALDLDPWIVTPRTTAYARYRARFVTNERPGRGPVEGVRAALLASRAPWALILSVDMPGVTATSLLPLLEFATEHAKSRLGTRPSARARGTDPAARRTDEVMEPGACCYRGDSDRRHPFPGLYHRGLLEWLDGSMPGGSMQELLDRAAAVSLKSQDIPQAIDLQSVLRNINRPADL